jgi:hypothetical protein
MSILAMNPKDSLICERFNLCEYGGVHLVTMPDGYRFVARDPQDSVLLELVRSGATVTLLTELGE